MPKYQKEKKKGWHPLGTETELSTTKRNWLKFNFKMKPHSPALVPSAAPVTRPLTFPPCHRSVKVSGVTFASAKKAAMHSLNLNKWQRTNSNKHCRTNRPTPTHTHTHSYSYIRTGDQIESLLALRQIERFNFSNRHNWHFARLQTNMPGNTKHTHLPHTNTYTHKERPHWVLQVNRGARITVASCWWPPLSKVKAAAITAPRYICNCASVCVCECMYMYLCVCVCCRCWFSLLW